MQDSYYEKPPQKRTFRGKPKERERETIMTENSRETELVLSPNEFAFYLDATKGNVNVVVGPYKQSLSQTDQLVEWDERSKRFASCTQRDAKKKFLVIPEGWYAPLKNPADTTPHPKTGNISDQSIAGLMVGKKVNISGPDSFALWPGQMAKVIQGHRLHSNQYLLVRVYDVEAFQKEMKSWLGKVPSDDEETTDEMKVARQADNYEGLDEETLTTGQQFIIKGTDVHFYIPPNGVEVVPVQRAQSSPDGKAQYVHNAVTLEQLQYCILADEDGNKRFIRGPDVVFPKPTERFVQTQGKTGTAAKKFKAIELNEISGLYIKVIKGYKEGEKSYEEGDEIFLTGKDQMIYFPREEHAIVRYEGKDKHHAVAIPSGEGRHVLDRMDGKIRMERGPSMFLADPRKEVIVRRILDDKSVQLMFPNNAEARQHNAALREIAESQEADFIAENALSNAMLKGPTPTTGRMLRRGAPAMEALYASTAEAVGRDLVGEEFARKNEYTPPRTVTLDTKYDGVVVVNVWTGYAVLVVDKQGNRRIVEGPETVLLEYDESLESMALSTGKPKNTDNLFETVYLRTRHNLVSDIIQVETQDLCKANVKLSYRVNFEGEGDDRFKWFDVENYVKYMTDHVRSMLKNAVKGISVREFYANAIEIVRDLVLGTKSEASEGAPDPSRPGLAFEENGMRVYDVEVLAVKLNNDDLGKKLDKQAREALDDAMDLEDANRKLKKLQELESIKIAEREATEQTVREMARLAVETTKVEIEADIQKLAEIAKRAQAKHEEAMEREADQLAMTEEEIKRRESLFKIDMEQAKAKSDARIADLKADLGMEIERLQAEQAKAVAIGEAVDPQLTAALAALSDVDLAEKLAAAVSPMAVLGEDNVADLLKEKFGNMGLERVLSRVFNGRGTTSKSKKKAQPQK